MLGTAYGKTKRGEDSREALEQMVRMGGETPYMRLLLGKAYLDF